MAASSPAPSNNSSDTNATTTTATITTGATTTTTATTPQRSDTPKQNLRGLNKPKCSKCGNVARSRCPYQSCKSCCAKAQNPCHIHVLKPNATFTDKTPSSSSPLFDQQSTDVSSTSTSLRAASLRQLSNNFAQFNGAHVPIRSRRPLTRKDAAALNLWRFSKLREYKDSNIEAENEAFDRYMQNVSLLEETLSANSSFDEANLSHTEGPTSTSENIERMILGLKVRLRSNPGRTDSFRQKIQDLVDQGLKRLRTLENVEKEPAQADDLDTQKELKKPKLAKNSQAESFSAISALTEKLNKARNEEDLKSCMDMMSQLFDQCEKTNLVESKDVEISEEQIAKEASYATQDSDYPLSRLYRIGDISQETLSSIDMYFNSLEQVEDL